MACCAMPGGCGQANCYLCTVVSVRGVTYRLADGRGVTLSANAGKRRVQDAVKKGEDALTKRQAKKGRATR